MPPLDATNGFFPNFRIVRNFINGHKVKGNATRPVLIVMTLVAVVFNDFPLFLGIGPGGKDSQHDDAGNSRFEAHIQKFNR